MTRTEKKFSTHTHSMNVGGRLRQRRKNNKNLYFIVEMESAFGNNMELEYTALLTGWLSELMYRF